ncbi:unnamed protein product [Miscanthus lutarioriparius]|uniref:Uncharacterized protein n=1 Tax=Miscanthus lutarioriparius TaxID=422564 RepID=A0A811R621_9POAL|nr:unnamed protein product [Miscanthus lutarioriparius]
MDAPAPTRGPASILTQANALLRKNLCFQKRNLKTNIGITLFPVLLCVILAVLQGVIDRELDKPKYQCGCACVDPGPAAVGDACRRTECGVQHSTLDQVGSCPIPNPTPWPALVQVPRPESRAVRTAGQPFDGLPDPDDVPGHQLLPRRRPRHRQQPLASSKSFGWTVSCFDFRLEFDGLSGCTLQDRCYEFLPA